MIITATVWSSGEGGPFGTGSDICVTKDKFRAQHLKS